MQRKIDELSILSSDLKPDLIIVTETWCNQSINNAMLNIPGYNIDPDLRCDRLDTTNGIGGGIIIYVRDGLTVLYNDDIKSSFNQYCRFNVKLGQTNKYVELIAVYRSPNSDSENDSKLCELIENCSEHCIIVGDFNFPKIDWISKSADNKGKDLLRICEEKHLDQLVDFKTHIKGNILDLVLTNTENVINIRSVGRLGKSDHEMLFIETSFQKQMARTTQLIPNWRKADIDKMKQKMNHIDWTQELENLDVEASWVCFRDKINKITAECVPMMKRRSETRPIWMDQTTLRSARRKHHLWKRYKETNSYRLLEEYRVQQKKAQKDIRRAKRKFERKISKNTGRGNRQFNSYIRNKTKSRSTIGPLNDGSGAKITDDEGMADILNRFFSSVFTNEGTGPIPTLDEIPCLEKIDTVNFELSDICEKINKLKPSCSPGPDRISARMLQSMDREIAVPLKMIFTKSMSENQVPEDWRRANITPIFKKGLKSNAGNYRPVSLTSLPCKIMESILRDKIVDHLLRNNLIGPSQHGFMQKRSCVTNLLEFLETVTSYVDQGTPMDLIYLDFSKAFDKVPRLRLINKLKAHSVDGNLLQWILSWLTDRQQRVVINGKASSWNDVLSGVPQGSVLGPLCFIVFINDIDGVAGLVNIILKFADDTKLGHTVNNDSDRLTLQKCLDDLYNWAEKWGMLFNVEKCKVMHVGRGNQLYEYTMNNEKLKVVSEEKDIGVKIHQSLKPSSHCIEAARTANGVLTQITKSFHYRDKVTFLNLYKTYVRCHLEFSVPAWNPWLEKDKELLENVQVRAIRMISGLKGSTYTERLSELNLMSLEDRRTRFDMLQTYKIINGIDRVDKATWFTTAAEINRRATRLTADPLNIVAKPANTDIRKHFFSNRVVNTWNKLPANIKQARNVVQFKKLYDSHVKIQTSEQNQNE